MRLVSFISTLAVFAALSQPVFASDRLRVIAHDGTYLGDISCLGTNAIGNQYGRFGSKYQLKSIWNTYGTYGSAYSSESAFNKYTSTPPGIYDDSEERYAYLSVNKFLSRKVISPWQLESGLR